MKRSFVVFLFLVATGCCHRIPTPLPEPEPAVGEVIMYRPPGTGMVLFYFLGEGGDCLFPGNFDNLANGHSTLIVQVPKGAVILRLFINRPEGLTAREIRVGPETRVFVDL